MLKVFRDNLKNLAWILWVIIALFVLALAADFGASDRRGAATRPRSPGRRRDGVPPGIPARLPEHDQLYRQIYGDQLTPEVDKQMYRQALTQTVVQKILLAEARRLGLRVTDAELREQHPLDPGLQGRAGALRRRGGVHAAARAANHITVADFETELRDQLLLKKLTDALAANSTSARTRSSRPTATRSRRPRSATSSCRAASFAAQVSRRRREVAAYFQAHKAEFKLPEQRDARLPAGRRRRQLAGQVRTCPTQELRSYYDAHKAEFAQEEQVHARHILVMVNDQRNDAPGAAARSGSAEEARRRRRLRRGGQGVSPTTPPRRTKGGDLGFFGRNQMVKEFEDAAFSAQAGKVVGPVKSSNSLTMRLRPK